MPAPKGKQLKGAKGTRPKGKANNDSKKRKRGAGKDEAVKKPRGPPAHIPLAEADPESEVEQDPGNALDENEVDMASAAQFAGGLDVKQITKSRKALKKEHRKSKPKDGSMPSKTALMHKAMPKGEATPQEKATAEGVLVKDLEEDDFAFGSGDSDDDGLSVMSGMSEDSLDYGSEDSLGSDSLDEEDEEGLFSTDSQDAAAGNSIESSENESDMERAYEGKRKRRNSASLSPDLTKAASKLPFKQADGSWATGEDPVEANSRVTFDADSAPSSEAEEAHVEPAPKSNPLGPRFGRMGIRQILELPSKSDRTTASRHEIAALARDIMADPENGLNLLKRLCAFCLHRFSDAAAAGKSKKGKDKEEDKGVLVDVSIRALAMLSLLAVFLDIVPTYRIRELTAAEKDIRVSQVVARQREWEEGLVLTYKRYVDICCREVDSKSALIPVALKCLCELLAQKSQFNFSSDIMDMICKHVGRPEWDESSVTCLDAIIGVFENDHIGSDALHLTRQLSKTIKSRSFRVHPSLLSCFLHLRLKTSLGGVRASGERVDKPDNRKKFGKKDPKKGQANPAHISKKAKKALKEKQEVEKEYAEAEMEVSKEVRHHDQTETLKIIFALYFRVVKLNQNSDLLAPALEGLARYAHLINVDFFKDVLDNLRRLMQGQEGGENQIQITVREQLLCISTAFELLSGQGEALNIDLADFMISLYSLLITLSVSPSFEEEPQKVDLVTDEGEDKPKSKKTKALASESELLFRTLNTVFVTSRTPNPPSRIAAFAKRILTCAMQWPPTSSLKAIDLVRKMLVKEASLHSMLVTEDKAAEGIYKGEVNDPALCHPEATVFWELSALEREHFDLRVIQAAEALALTTEDQ